MKSQINPDSTAADLSPGRFQEEVLRRLEELNELVAGMAFRLDAERPEPERLLDMSQAAQILGISEGTLRNWRSAGTAPPATLLGGRVLFRRRDLEEWINIHREEKRPENGN